MLFPHPLYIQYYTLTLYASGLCEYLRLIRHKKPAPVSGKGGKGGNKSPSWISMMGKGGKKKQSQEVDFLYNGPKMGLKSIYFLKLKINPSIMAIAPRATSPVIIQLFSFSLLASCSSNFAKDSKA